MIWRGSKRGWLADWITQSWIRLTGRRVDLTKFGWLEGPIAPTTGIGPSYIQDLARQEGLVFRRDKEAFGIIPQFSVLSGAIFDTRRTCPSVIQFYQETSNFELDAWAEWHGTFRPFGSLLAFLFSRRLQQLNVPLSSLDTRLGMTSDVLHLLDTKTSAVRRVVWMRRLNATKNQIYAGFYSVCRLPNRSDPCVKVVFPLPNGNAIVIMKTEQGSDGSLTIISAGNGFGEPGFYFTVRDSNGNVWARYVKAMKESIHVYPDNGSQVRADHVLKFFGITFLRLHYRMRRNSRAMQNIERPED